MRIEAERRSPARQVHDGGTFGRGVAGPDNTLDAVALDDHGAFPQQLPGLHVEQQTGPDYRAHRGGHPAV